MKKTILCAAVLILMTAPFSYSQFIYVDIIPDTTMSINGGAYNLDLNSDGILDFQIKLAKTAFPDTMNQVGITYLADSCYIASYNIDGCGNFSKAFDINDVIGNYTEWSDIAVVGVHTLIMSTCMATGSFCGQTNKYLGLKMIKNTTTFYGWVGIDVASYANWFKMKDYACNSNAINAGLTVGIPAFKPKGLGNNLFFYPNPVNDKLTIETRTQAKNQMISIYNIQGQLVLNSLLENGNAALDISGFANGMYLLKLTTDKGVDARKFLKE